MLSSLSTEVLSDAADEAVRAGALAPGDRPTVLDLPGIAVGSPVAGQVRSGTVIDDEQAGIPGLAEFIGGAGSGSILCLGWRARARASIFGGLASEAAQARGVGGLVVDGWTRDVADVEELGFPVWSRGTTPFSGKGRLAVAELGAGCALGGLWVMDGDWLIGDRTGVLVLRAIAVDPVLKVALDLQARDERFSALLKDGRSFGEASAVSRTM